MTSRLPMAQKKAPHKGRKPRSGPGPCRQMSFSVTYIGTTEKVATNTTWAVPECQKTYPSSNSSHSLITQCPQYVSATERPSTRWSVPLSAGQTPRCQAASSSTPSMGLGTVRHTRSSLRIRPWKTTLISRPTKSANSHQVCTNTTVRLPQLF